MRPVSVSFDIVIGTLSKSDAGNMHTGLAGYNYEDVKVGITDSLCGFGRAMDFMATCRRRRSFSLILLLSFHKVETLVLST